MNPNDYPKTVTLKNNSELSIRPLRNAEVSPALDEAYFICEKMGFKEAAVLKNFIKDQAGNYEDLVIMVKELRN